jgi:Asp-tRNA(Asn)/Glu-tRNA(Gln) amidotransferase B subunit
MMRSIHNVAGKIEETALAIVRQPDHHAMPDPVPVDRVRNVIEALIAENPDKWQQTLLRPQLVGWFVGQTMQKLNGQADSEECLRKGHDGVRCPSIESLRKVIQSQSARHPSFPQRK